MGIGSDIVDAVTRIRNGDFKTGWGFFNRIKKERILAKAELEAAKSALTDQLIALEERQRQAVLTQAQTEAARQDIKLQVDLKLALHSLEVLEVETKKKLTQQAVDRGLTVDSDQKLRVSETESRLRTDEESRLVDLRIKEKDTDSQREIDKFRLTKSIELQNTLEEMREQVRLVIIADLLTGHQKIELVIEQADRINMQLQEIRRNPELDEITRLRMLNDREEFLLTLKEYRRAEENRLLQTGNRQGIQEVRETSNLRRDYRKALKAREE
jgi:hypothetical protein